MLKLSHHKDYMPKKGCTCGAENAKFDFVPDTIFGVSIISACCIHDDRYIRGGTRADKEIADREFLDNMLEIIDNVKKWYYPTMWARHRAVTYYDGVVRGGDSSFNFKDSKK